MTKIKPVTEWNMWCVFVHGHPVLDTLSPYEWQAARQVDGWNVPAAGQIPEVRELRISVVPKVKRKVKPVYSIRERIPGTGIGEIGGTKRKVKK